MDPLNLLVISADDTLVGEIEHCLDDAVRTQFSVSHSDTPGGGFVHGRGVTVYDYALGHEGLVGLAQHQRPVVVVTTDHDQTVEILGAGAADYIERDSLTAEVLERAVVYAMGRADQAAAMREMESRFQRTVSGIRDGVWDWDLHTGASYFSPRWCALAGYAPSAIGSIEEWFQVIHPDDFAPFKARLDAHLNGATPVFKHEYRISTHAGIYKWMLVRGVVERDSMGQARRIAGSQTDIDKQKLTEARILYDAQFDRITGLVNRFQFLEEVALEFEQMRTNPEYRFSVMLLDLDRFKYLNDSMGHAIGDQVLLAAGQRIQANLRGQDIVGRYGGDEFVALIKGTASRVSATFAKGIVESFREPFRIDGREYRHGISIGMATASASEYTAPEDVIRDADIAMHRAKDEGRNRHVVFTTEMREDLANQFSLERDLRTAIYQHDLSVHYQPVVSLTTGKPISFEALCRWYHGTRGFVSPADFIPIAEDTGLISEIGEFVLGQSVADMSQWKAPDPISVCVNVSPKQFTNRNLVHLFKKAVAEHDLPAGSVGVEVTESALMVDEDASIETMKAMRRANFFVHLDDFGTGYSALHSILRFPIDGLKIDQSFVRNLDKGKRAKQIIETIVQLAHNLGIYVIAEGIETKAHWNILKELGVDFGQGYYIAKPMPASDVQPWLTALPK
jgi:diguanylate cyclase (GGDEF)-like protein/PAS domain S-box-containing protein